MGQTPEQKAAYRKLEETIEELVVSYNSFDQGEIPVGFVLILCGVRSMSQEHDDDYEDGDEEELVSRFAAFPKIGQMPVITRGILESYMDRWRG